MEKNTARARKVVFLLHVLIPIFNCKCKDLQGGTVPFVDLFFAIV